MILLLFWRTAFAACEPEFPCMLNRQCRMFDDWLLLAPGNSGPAPLPFGTCLAPTRVTFLSGSLETEVHVKVTERGGHCVSAGRKTLGAGGRALLGPQLHHGRRTACLFTGAALGGQESTLML